MFVKITHIVNILKYNNHSSNSIVTYFTLVKQLCSITRCHTSLNLSDYGLVCHYVEFQYLLYRISDDILLKLCQNCIQKRFFRAQLKSNPHKQMTAFFFLKTKRQKQSQRKSKTLPLAEVIVWNKLYMRFMTVNFFYRSELRLPVESLNTDECAVLAYSSSVNSMHSLQQ